MTDLFDLSTSFWCSVNILGFVSGGINTKSTDFSSSRSFSLVVLGEENSSFNCRKIKNPKIRIRNERGTENQEFLKDVTYLCEGSANPKSQICHSLQPEWELRFLFPLSHPGRPLPKIENSAENSDRNIKSDSAGQPKLGRKIFQHPQSPAFVLQMLDLIPGHPSGNPLPLQVLLAGCWICLCHHFLVQCSGPILNLVFVPPSPPSHWSLHPAGNFPSIQTKPHCENKLQAHKPTLWWFLK